MTNNKKKFIVGAVVAAAAGVLLCLYLYGGNDRKNNPENYVRDALQNTYAMLDTSAYDAGWIFDILDDTHQIELGLSFKDIDVDADIDRQILSMAQLARLEAQVLRNAGERKMTADLVIGSVGAAILNASMYMDGDELAVMLPQGFDYFITADPQRFVSEWNGFQGAAAAVSGISDESFYRGYEKLFAKAENPGILEIANDSRMAFADAEYGYVDGGRGVYTYSLKLKAESFNAWYRTMAESVEAYGLFKQMGLDMSGLYDFSVTEDLDILLTVEDEAVKAASIKTVLQEGVSFESNVISENQLEDVNVKITMRNTSGSEGSFSGAAFEPAGVLNPYLMIEHMPETVTIEIDCHRGEFSQETHIQMEAGDRRTELAWEYLWDTSGTVLDNFKLSGRINEYRGGESAGAGINIQGNLVENREKAEFLSNFSDISYYLEDFDGSRQALGIALKLNLKSAASAEIGYEKAGATHISDITPLKLMNIYANFKNDPVIGGMLP